MRKILIALLVLADFVLIYYSMSISVFLYGYSAGHIVILLVFFGVILNIIGVILLIRKNVITPLLITTLVFLVILINDVGINIARILKNLDGLVLYISVIIVFINSLVLKVKKI